MFITINRYDGLESTINLNQIVEFRVTETRNNNRYVTIFMSNNGYVDITFEQYRLILKIISQYEDVRITVQYSLSL